MLRALRELHERERPNAWILHNVLPVVSLGVYQLAAQLEVPIVQWLHNYRPLSPGGTLQVRGRLLEPEDPWILWKESLAGTWRGRFATSWLSLAYAFMRRRRHYSSVRAWVAVSDEMRRIFIRGGWPESRLFTLRHSWDVAPSVAELPDQGYFLYVGRLIEEKGVRFLVDLWKDPALEHLDLVIAGDGPLRDELSRTTPKNVRWPGYVTGGEKGHLVAGCRAVLFPSLWPEPLSTVAYEAYEAAKPVIASSAGGMKEIVFDARTGRVLEPGNRAAWCEAILQLENNPSLAQKWGTAGRLWLEQNVSPAGWNLQFDTLMKSALAS